MENYNYIHIQGWMVNQLKLKGNELLVYAIIHGFSQDQVSQFRGSLKYIQEFLQISRSTTKDVLQNLVEKELIEKINVKIQDIIITHYKIK